MKLATVRCSSNLSKAVRDIAEALSMDCRRYCYELSHDPQAIADRLEKA